MRLTKSDLPTVLYAPDSRDAEKSIRQLKINYHLDLDVRDSSGRTPLHCAVLMGKVCVYVCISFLVRSLLLSFFKL